MSNVVNGKIIKALSGFYYVLTEDNIYTCRARGNFRNEGITPIVGDNVEIQLDKDNNDPTLEGYVTVIKDRDNELLRPKIANVDYNIIIISAKEPDFSNKLLDKQICLTKEGSVIPILIFTKLDLLIEEEYKEINKIIQYYKKIGFHVFENNMNDIKELKKLIANKYVSISGQSGSGKSTFINKLSGNLNIETAAISKVLGRGKHTTRHVEFYKIKDFYIADTPGFSSIDITFIEKEELKYLFDEFSNKTCKYRTCNHLEENNCSVKDAVRDKTILESRYKNYESFFKEKNNYKRRK